MLTIRFFIGLRSKSIMTSISRELCICSHELNMILNGNVFVYKITEQEVNIILGNVIDRKMYTLK